MRKVLTAVQLMSQCPNSGRAAIEASWRTCVKFPPLPSVEVTFKVNDARCEVVEIWVAMEKKPWSRVLIRRLYGDFWIGGCLRGIGRQLQHLTSHVMLFVGATTKEMIDCGKRARHLVRRRLVVLGSSGGSSQATPRCELKALRPRRE